MIRPAKLGTGGLPIGALLVKQHVADAMKPGDHGSTFAGNPLVCNAALAVVDTIDQPQFLQVQIAPCPPSYDLKFLPLWTFRQYYSPFQALP